MQTRSTTIATLFTLSACAIVGCGGGGQVKTAKVSGKVTYNNQAVTGGTLTFTPKAADGEPGKPGSAVIDEDGNFTVSTYGSGDGAVVAAHRISYSAPAVEGGDNDSDEHSAAKASPFAGLVPKETEVVVEAGENNLTVELVKP